ncbi:MAG TPA: efflux RND transporter periplasmic adaptor subunit [Gemmataceae bacterium]|nr:efflux RND transporter periplasmic adaptor subunit [Gemmataceae bacterium]
MTLRRFAPLRRSVAVFVLLIPACAPKAADTGARREQDPIPVTVAALAPITLNRTVPVVGSLDPYKEVTLAPKVDGRVLRVIRDVGDVVYPGDVLLELDATDYELDVRVARAGLEAELARINLTELPTGELDLDSVKSVARARASLNLAEKDFVRVKDERARGIGSSQSYDKAEAEVELAKTAKQVAEADARATLANARKMKASLEQAEQRLHDTVLRAPVPEEWPAWAAAVGPGFTPFRYQVAQRMVWEGEMVRGMPEKYAFRLVIDHALKLRAAVPEKFAPDVCPGQTVAVRVDAYSDRAFTGVVSRVSPTVDSQNRTFQVEVVVPNCDARWRIKAGTFAKGEILIRADAGVATVPPEAIVSFAGVNKVFVADGDHAKAIEVQLGQRDKTWVEVIGPVPPNVKVITSGFSQLVDGSPIRIR